MTLHWVVEMPPSPALRYSPGKEPRDGHKRGRSLESGILFREKDDDLALFNEMQSRERESFLLQSSDDLEDSFCNFLCRLPKKRMCLSLCCCIWDDIHTFLTFFFGIILQLQD